MHLSSLIKQKPKELVHHVLRRHWITFLPRIGTFLILFSVPIILYLLFKSVTPGLLTGGFSYPTFVLFASSYYLSIYLFFFAEFITFYLDEWIITSDRIVDIEQLGLFSRSVSELDLYRIQDVTSDIDGVIPTFFNYGNVTIKTASTNAHIIFKNIHAPNKVRAALIQLAQDGRRRKNRSHQKNKNVLAESKNKVIEGTIE